MSHSCEELLRAWSAICSGAIHPEDCRNLAHCLRWGGSGTYSFPALSILLGIVKQGELFSLDFSRKVTIRVDDDYFVLDTDGAVKFARCVEEQAEYLEREPLEDDTEITDLERWRYNLPPHRRIIVESW